MRGSQQGLTKAGHQEDRDGDVLPGEGLKGVMNGLFTFLLAILLGSSAPAAENKGAVVVLDSTSFRLRSNQGARLFKRRVVRVDRESGREHAEFYIVDNKFIKTKKVAGLVRNADGKVVRKLKKKDVERGPLYAGYVLYSDTTYQRFTLGHSTYPYEVEYSYEQRFDSLFFWPDWRPQKRVPVVRSVYEVLNEGSIAFEFHAKGDAPEPVGGRHRLTWMLEDLDAQSEETEEPEVFFAPVQFTLGEYPGRMDSWNGLAKWYDRIAKARYASSPELSQKVQQLTDGSVSHREKVVRLYNFLRDQTRYVAISIGVGGWQPHGALETFKSKYGDCKDLTTLMITMLKEAGIKAYPALTRTRDRGPLTTEFPSSQFNHLIGFVPLAADTIWLECTTDYVPAGDLPGSVEGCEVLVVKENSGELIKTPESNAQDNRWTSLIDAALSPAGLLTFSGEIHVYGNPAHSFRSYLSRRTPKRREEWLGRRLHAYVPNLDLASYEITNLDENLVRPLLIKFRGSAHRFAKRSGSRLFFNPNFLSRLDPDDIPKAETREGPLRQDYRYQMADTLRLSIPDSYVVEASPDTALNISPGVTYSTRTTIDDLALMHVRSIREKEIEIPPELYESYVKGMRSVLRRDQSRIVLKKKTYN